MWNSRGEGDFHGSRLSSSKQAHLKSLSDWAVDGLRSSPSEGPETRLDRVPEYYGALQSRRSESRGSVRGRGWDVANRLSSSPTASFKYGDESGYPMADRNLSDRRSFSHGSMYMPLELEAGEIVEASEEEAPPPPPPRRPGQTGAKVQSLGSQVSSLFSQFDRRYSEMPVGGWSDERPPPPPRRLGLKRPLSQQTIVADKEHGQVAKRPRLIEHPPKPPPRPSRPPNALPAPNAVARVEETNQPAINVAVSRPSVVFTVQPTKVVEPVEPLHVAPLLSVVSPIALASSEPAEVKNVTDDTSDLSDGPAMAAVEDSWGDQPGPLLVPIPAVLPATMDAWGLPTATAGAAAIASVEDFSAEWSWGESAVTSGLTWGGGLETDKADEDGTVDVWDAWKAPEMTWGAGLGGTTSPVEEKEGWNDPASLSLLKGNSFSLPKSEGFEESSMEMPLERKEVILVKLEKLDAEVALAETELKLSEGQAAIAAAAAKRLASEKSILNDHRLKAAAVAQETSALFMVNGKRPRTRTPVGTGFVVQSILLENRALAIQAERDQSYHVIPSPSRDARLPLYSRPLEAPCWTRNMADFSRLRGAVAKVIKKEVVDEVKVQQKLARNYRAVAAEWNTRVAKLEEASEKLYGTATPSAAGLAGLAGPAAGPKRRQSRYNTPHDIEVATKLSVELARKKELYDKCKADCPPMHLSARSKRFDSFSENTNGRLTTDRLPMRCAALCVSEPCPTSCNCPRAVYRQESMPNPWSDAEKCVFVDKFVQFPKDFRRISSYLVNKSTADCISFYYNSKHVIGFKQLLHEHINRKRGTKKNWALTATALSNAGVVIPKDVWLGEEVGQAGLEAAVKVSDIRYSKLTSFVSGPGSAVSRLKARSGEGPEDSDAGSAGGSASEEEESLADGDSDDASEGEERPGRSTRSGQAGQTGKEEDKKRIEKRGPVKWSEAEKDKFLEVFEKVGKKWSKLADLMPGKTANQIKNYYQSYRNKQHAEAKEAAAIAKSAAMASHASHSRDGERGVATTGYSKSAPRTPTRSLPAAKQVPKPVVRGKGGSAPPVAARPKSPLPAVVSGQAGIRASAAESMTAAATSLQQQHLQMVNRSLANSIRPQMMLGHGGPFMVPPYLVDAGLTQEQFMNLMIQQQIQQSITHTMLAHQANMYLAGGGMNAAVAQQMALDTNFKLHLSHGAMGVPGPFERPPPVAGLAAAPMWPDCLIPAGPSGTPSGSPTKRGVTEPKEMPAVVDAVEGKEELTGETDK